MRISDWSSDVCSSDLRNDGLAYVKGAVQIDAHQAAPIVLRHVGDEFFRIDAGAMHKVINLAITLRNVGGGLFAGLFVGYVCAVRADCAGSAHFLFYRLDRKSTRLNSSH